MIARILADLRMIRAWLAWVGACRRLVARRRCRTVLSIDPTEVGRQEQLGAAILETAAWLEASGWADVEAGERQVYASFLLERRAAYERGEVRAS